MDHPALPPADAYDSSRKPIGYRAGSARVGAERPEVALGVGDGGGVGVDGASTELCRRGWLNDGADARSSDSSNDSIVAQVQALPPDARAAFDELRSVIALVPWRSEPASHDNPDGEVRFAPFSSTIGSGFVYFLILEDLNRVDLLELIWIG